MRKGWSQQPMSSSPTSTETPATRPHREIRAAPSPEALKKWSRPVASPPRSNLSQTPVLNPNSRPSTASPAAHVRPRGVSRPLNGVSQRTSLSPDSDLANQSLEAPRLINLKKSSTQDTNSSLDSDPDEFADKRSRPQRTETHRRSNQKSYFEGRGRYERVSSKVLLQQSANSTIIKKKANPVPKLIKARRMDVFIPSTLSVAALAKLLNIKLGK